MPGTRAAAHVPGTRAGQSATLTEIADGVFAYVQSDGGWCLNNAG